MYVAENVPLIFAQDVELYGISVSACLYVTWSDLTVNYGTDWFWGRTKKQQNKKNTPSTGQWTEAIMNGTVDIRVRQRRYWDEISSSYTGTSLFLPYLYPDENNIYVYSLIYVVLFPI